MTAIPYQVQCILIDFITLQGRKYTSLNSNLRQIF